MSVIDFKLNSLIVREHIFCGFYSLKFVKICFIGQIMIHLGECSMFTKREVFCYFRMDCPQVLISSSWLIIFVLYFYSFPISLSYQLYITALGFEVSNNNCGFFYFLFHVYQIFSSCVLIFVVR